MTTYNISKSICEVLGINFIEHPSLSDQEINNIPKDELFYIPSSVPSYPIMKGENHPFYGKRHSEESKRKMSIARKGKTFKPLTEEHKNKLRKKRPHVGKNIANGKSMVWIVTDNKTGKEWKIKNLNAFCREHGLAPGNLYKTVTGKCHHHKGYSIRHE